jgi:parvulin-like peptidyl-prolyl isomerase
MNTIKAQLKPQVVQELVTHCLLVQESKTVGIELTDDEVLSALKERGAAQNPPVSIDELKKIVEDRGDNFEDLKADFKEGLVLTKFMEGKWAGRTDVNDSEAQVFYNEHPQSFEEPEMVRVSHILIRLPNPADSDADPNEAKAAAKAKAEEVLKQIREGGDFAELAKANPGDPLSAANGGDLGFFPRGEMVSSFETAAFGLEPNGISDLVESPYGYHIIKKTGHKDARTVPFEEAKPEIIAGLKSQKQNAFVREYAELLKEKATIVYTPGNEPAVAMPAPMITPAAPTTSTPQTDQPAVSEDNATVADPNMN